MLGSSAKTCERADTFKCIAVVRYCGILFSIVLCFIFHTHQYPLHILRTYQCDDDVVKKLCAMNWKLIDDLLEYQYISKL